MIAQNGHAPDAWSARAYTDIPLVVLPSWWMRCFDERLAHAATALILTQGGLNLPFERRKIYLLLFIIDQLQEILAHNPISEKATLVIPFQETLSRINRSSKLLPHTLAQTLMALPHLGFFREENHTFIAQQIFAGGHWQSSPETSLTLSINDSSIELISGFIDSYRELYRSPQSSLKPLLSEPPLTLWRNICLDLLGMEFATYLRIESLSQWEACDLDLDGTVGLPLSLITAHTFRADSSFDSKIKLLKRLGTKLQRHGYLKSHRESQYLAFTQNPKGLMLVCQRKSPETRAECPSSIADYFWQRAAQSSIPYANQFRLSESLKDLWHEFYLWSKHLTTIPHVSLGKNEILPLPLLIWEWTARRAHGSHEQRLPEAIEQQFFKEQTHFPDRCTYILQKLMDKDFGLTSLLEKAQGLSWINPLAIDGVESLMPDVQLNTSPLEGLAQGLKETPPIPSTHQVMQAEKTIAASKDLLELKHKSPAQYEEIYRQYLNSLDEKSRKLILDIQKRMSADKFDDQIMPRLSRFIAQAETEILVANSHHRQR